VTCSRTLSTIPITKSWWYRYKALTRIAKRNYTKILKSIRKLHWEEPEVVEILERVFSKPVWVYVPSAGSLGVVAGQHSRWHFRLPSAPAGPDVARENCGRYLLRNPESSPRMASFLETLSRKKTVQHLAQQQFSSKWPIISMFMRENSSSETLKQ
jgi:hypothetical protein